MVIKLLLNRHICYNLAGQDGVNVTTVENSQLVCLIVPRLWVPIITVYTYLCVSGYICGWA